MKKQAQYGKGLGGFMTGLLLATAIIVGILFFLNKSAKDGFKELSQPQIQASEPETLQPKGASSSELTESGAETAASDVAVSGVAAEDTAASETPVREPEPAADEKTDSEVVPGLPAPLQPPTSSKANERNTVGHEAEKHAAGNKPAEDVKKKPEPAKPVEPVKKPTVASKPAMPSEKHPTKQPEKHMPAKSVDKPTDKAKTVQPTPEQILNSGSIEKARKAANEQAKSATQAHHAAPAAAHKETGKKVIVQMGSYGDRSAADAQRAKLAMMGVQSAVAETAVNGKKVYRVQSSVLTQDAAQKVQQTLQKNGVNSFTRSAE